MLLKLSEWDPSPAEREALCEAGKVYDRKGLTRAGRAFSKHAECEPLWGDPSKEAKLCNERGQAILHEIVFSDDTIWEQGHHPKHGDIVQGWRPDGRGARWQVASEFHFMGFLDPRWVFWFGQ